MKTYKCTMCGGVFVSNWSDKEAMEESREYFGEVQQDELTTVCDVCFNKIHPVKFPLATKITKAAIDRTKRSKS